MWQYTVTWFEAISMWQYTVTWFEANFNVAIYRNLVWSKFQYGNIQ